MYYLRSYFLCLLVVSSVLLTGCLESSFNISDDSRLPVWLDIPEDMDRENLVVRLDYYTSGKAVFSLIDKRNRKLLDKVVARVRDSKPLEQDGTSWPMGERAVYPIYSVVTFEEVSEIVEHMVRGPVFSIPESGEVISNIGCQNREAGGFICEQEFILRKE